MRRLALALLLWLLSAGAALAQQSGFVTSIIVANNVTPILIKNGPGVVNAIGGFGNAASDIYIKLYNLASVTGFSCGTRTPVARYIAAGAVNGGSPAVSAPTVGATYTTGIVMCITAGIADNDTTAPPAASFIVNVHWR